MNTRTALLSSLTTLATLGALAAPTLAQPTDDWGGTDGSTPVTTAEAPADSPAPAAAADAASWGIGTTWPTGGDAAYVNFLKAMGPDNWLNLGFSFRINKGVDGGGDSQTVIGLGARAGYRMYRAQAGRVRPYIEPYAGLDIGTLDKVGPSLRLVLGGNFGIDYQVMPQFTFGVAVGAGLAISNDFDNVDLGTYTTSLNATFWW